LFSSPIFSLLLVPPPPRSTLFPYTTLFRSSKIAGCVWLPVATVGLLLWSRLGVGRAYQYSLGFTVDSLLIAILVIQLLQLRRRRSEEHTSELQSPCNLVCRLLLEKKKNKNY